MSQALKIYSKGAPFYNVLSFIEHLLQCCPETPLYAKLPQCFPPHRKVTFLSQLKSLKEWPCGLTDRVRGGPHRPVPVILSSRKWRMTGSKELPTVIPFGPFGADLSSQELRKQGISLRLPRQSFQILKMLLQRSGQLVSREELRASLWPSDTFVDFEHSLNAAVNRLREVLGDDADNPRYIETLPRRGYRFVNSIAPKALTPPEAVPAAQTKPRQRLWVWLPLAATALLLAAVFSAVDVDGLRSKLLSRSAAQPQIRSLAVLPLANMSGDPQQEYFADGMTEELITELSRITSLKVISQTSVMQYKGEKKKSLSQIGRELHVDAVMEGSVLRSGNRVRIAAHVIYAPTDQSLMAETYEEDLGDVLKLQRDVAESITEKVRARLTPEQQSRGFFRASGMAGL
jgi:TolB-like protein/DNA-binding winged helix-turn-helix (wHTH) protein